jgi:hypothetical protein
VAALLASIALPDALAAGDQWRVSVPEGDYASADGWAATLYLRGPGVVDSVGSAESGEWVFTVSAASTATKPAGTYTAAVRYVKGSDVQTLPATPVEVTPNIATAAANAYQSHEARCIPLLQDAIEKRCSVDLKAYTITSRQATREELTDMVALLRQYRATVARQKRGGSFGSYAVRFGRGW